MSSERSASNDAALRNWFSDAPARETADDPRARAVETVREWTRARFALTNESDVLVVEMAGTLRGMPPLQTVIAFWSDDRRHHFTIFKPLVEVAESDLPPRWLKSTLAQSEPFGCECC